MSAEKPISTMWTVKDVATFLGISQATVWRWQMMGKIPAGKKMPGRSVRWDPEVVKKWLEKLPAANK